MTGWKQLKAIARNAQDVVPNRRQECANHSTLNEVLFSKFFIESCCLKCQSPMTCGGLERHSRIEQQTDQEVKPTGELLVRCKGARHLRSNGIFMVQKAQRRIIVPRNPNGRRWPTIRVQSQYVLTSL
jgi:hypothetical protein